MSKLSKYLVNLEEKSSERLPLESICDISLVVTKLLAEYDFGHMVMCKIIKNYDMCFKRRPYETIIKGDKKKNKAA